MQNKPCQKLLIDYDSAEDKRKFCSVATNRCTLKIKEYHRHHWSYNRDHLIDIIYIPESLHLSYHGKMYYDKEEMMFRAGHIHFYWTKSEEQKIKPGELLNTKFKHIRFLIEIRHHLDKEDLYYEKEYGWEPRNPKLRKLI